MRVVPFDKKSGDGARQLFERKVEAVKDQKEKAMKIFKDSVDLKLKNPLSF